MPLADKTYNLILTPISASDNDDDHLPLEHPTKNDFRPSSDLILPSGTLGHFGNANDVPDSGNATWISAYINLTSTVIGAGILGLPHAFASTGFVGGASVLLFCASSSALALYFLAKCAKRVTPPITFFSVAEAILPGYSGVIDLAVAIKCYGVATSYLVVIGDLMPAAMHQLHTSSAIKQRPLWIIFGFLIVAPLSCFESLDALKYTSSLSITFIMFLTIIIVMFAFPNLSGFDPCQNFSDPMSCKGEEEYFLLNLGSLRALSIFVFSYTCQQNLFSIVNELREPTQARINSVIVSSIGTAFSVFLIVGLAGYTTYGSNVASDLLKSYPEIPVTTAARICVSFIVAFSYPLQCNPARRSVLTLLKSVFGKGEEPSLVVYRIRYTAITAFFLSTSLLIALTVQDLSLVLSFVGATGSTTVSYILPGIFYYKMFQNEGPKWMRVLAFSQYILGLIIIPVCLTLLVFK